MEKKTKNVVNSGNRNLLWFYFKVRGTSLLSLGLGVLLIARYAESPNLLNLMDLGIYTGVCAIAIFLSSGKERCSSVNLNGIPVLHFSIPLVIMAVLCCTLAHISGSSEALFWGTAIFSMLSAIISLWGVCVLDGK